jgi:hypothetical protein
VSVMRSLAGDAASEIKAKGKPELSIAGLDGNVYAVIGEVRMILLRNRMTRSATDYRERVALCGDYEDVLALSMEYVEFE